MLSSFLSACLALLSAIVPLPAQPIVVFNPGTNLPIRFLQTLESGRDSTGTTLLAQTLAPLASQGCVAAPAYVQLAGHITSSRSGGRFGKRGEFGIVFDSIHAQLGAWLPMNAVLDTLEYGMLTRQGVVYGTRRSLVRHVSTVGAITAVAASAVEELPAALLGSYWAVRHGPSAQLFAGETGSITLLQPLAVRASFCQPARSSPALTQIVLPPNLPHTTSGDPINFVFAGTATQLDSAFDAAGWKRAQRRRPTTIAKSIISTLAAIRASNPPVSNQFLFGRAEDVTYELEGPNARIRHHIRVWHIDGKQDLWLGAAILDDGLALMKRTHRIDPRIDSERDFLVRDLEAGGRAKLAEYVQLPGAIMDGRLAHGQRFVSDARAAVIELE